MTLWHSSTHFIHTDYYHECTREDFILNYSRFSQPNDIQNNDIQKKKKIIRKPRIEKKALIYGEAFEYSVCNYAKKVTISMKLPHVVRHL